MPRNKPTSPDPREHISPDIVYQEMYQEMRRYRDYELTSSTWYTAILLAIAGAVLTLKFGNGGAITDVSGILAKVPLKVGITILSLLVVSSGVYAALYVSSRYSHMRKWVNENLEPAWKKYEPPDRRLKPIFLIISTQIFLAAIAIIALWLL